MELIDNTNKMITSNITIDTQLMLIWSTIDMSLTVFTIVNTVFFQYQNSPSIVIKFQWVPSSTELKHFYNARCVAFSFRESLI